MKKIKTYIVLLGFLAMGIVQAQEKEIDLFSIPLSSPNEPGKLRVELLNGSINVTAYDGKEVIVKVAVEEEKESGDSKYGMKRVGGSGLNISAEEEDNVVKINNKAWSRKTDFEIKVPKNFSLKLKTVNDGDIYVEGVNGNMEISNVNGHITLKDISGAVTTDTTNGEVKVNFNTIQSNSDMAFSSFNGNVEVTFPATLKANVKAKSDMGEVYSDFDLAISDQKPRVEKGESSRGYKVKIEQWIRGTINGGGPEMLFKTFNGDILIKSK